MSPSVSEKEPAAQSTHSLRPVSGCTDPTGQGAHCTVPLSTANVPGLQPEHVCAFSSAENEPGAQSTHEVRPGCGPLLPFAQKEQVSCAVRLVKVPRPQGSHCTAAALGVAVPVAHSVQLCAPVEPE